MKLLDGKFTAKKIAEWFIKNNKGKVATTKDIREIGEIVFGGELTRYTIQQVKEILKEEGSVRLKDQGEKKTLVEVIEDPRGDYFIYKKDDKDFLQFMVFQKEDNLLFETTTLNIARREVRKDQEENKKKLKDGAINYSYSEKGLPTYAFIVDNDDLDEDEKYELVKEAYEECDNKVYELNELIRNKGYDLYEDYYGDEITIKLKDGYYEGFSIILEVGYNEEELKELIEFAKKEMKVLSEIPNVKKVISGGWNGPVVVKDREDTGILEYKKERSRINTDILKRQLESYGFELDKYDWRKVYSVKHLESGEVIEFDKDHFINLTCSTREFRYNNQNLIDNLEQTLEDYGYSIETDW